jgi:hypothetical protein
MVIQFVKRHDHTWPRLFDFTAKRGIESNEMDLATNRSVGGLLPLPRLAIERRGRRFVEESVVAPSLHALGSCGPPGSRMASGLDDRPARLRMKFDFFSQIRFIEQRLRDPNSSRIADPDDARFGGQCDYGVTTSCNAWQAADKASAMRVVLGPSRQPSGNITSRPRCASTRRLSLRRGGGSANLLPAGIAR